MRKTSLPAIALGLALSLAGASLVLAHEGEETLAVEPSTLEAGGTVVLAGSGLEPDSERVLILAGENLIVEFGTVKTDADGRFQKELTIPGHLPAGTYELRAIGDETLTVPLGILEAAPVLPSAAPSAEPAPSAKPVPNVSPAPNPTPAPVATVAPIDPTKTVVPRERTPVELGLILALIPFAAVAGGLLVWRAERFRGGSPA